MANTKPTGRRCAEGVELDPTLEVLRDTTSRSAGRRARRSALETEQAPMAERHHAGRRYEEIQRYGIAPEQADLAARFADNVIPLAPSAGSAAPEQVEDKLFEALHAPRQPKSRLGFTHKVAAVAAVSGLTLAAITPHFSGDEVESFAAEAQRTATSAVVDVKAPGNGEVEVVRAALTSDRSEQVVKEERFSEVLTASGGDISTIASPGLLDRPLDSNRITSPFGHRKNPTGAGYMNHSGIDYGVACGTPVKAAASGTVTVSGWAGHSGKRVTISHGNGLETGYSHNSSLIAKVGQKVERGEVIALSGTTGNSTGCHVHFEVITNGQFQNPAGWL
ncbi:M23 family metallopeptidase [Glutamicibacter sp. MNS18]|uniref:M23 family metallopeptidase n=1 Tax=Glutamicibacter sp. MNS18 TaxID=2989817 RepID=UPI0022368A06|nr:M23 family metallopeptidase [Glutamicibacter sp. MNS18]MCW4466488.1 M23 family metallopeptidase [Glutamicibacter sp. MNS18]